MTKIVLRTLILAEADECFGLSLSVDAHTNSMARSGERAVAGALAGEMRLGDTVTWRATHFGVPFRMTSAITEYERPLRFVDEQTSGPFRTWWHEHTFTRVDVGTQMTDVVRYSVPAGWAGRLVDAVALSTYLRRLLAARNAWLKAALEVAGKPPAPDL